MFSGWFVFLFLIGFVWGIKGCFCWGVFGGSRRVFSVCEPMFFFVIVFADYLVCPPSYFTRLILVLFYCVIYIVLRWCCVRFVYSLSRTWLAPVQRCMYDTCYMSVLSHKIMQKCEKLHNKTLQNTTSVHVN